MTPRVQPHRLGFLTVGQTARILGISPSALRLWENVGLVSPARSNGRYRLYSPELLAVLKRIKYLRDVKLLNFP
ncbi:MAG: MerR family transcriptional regulator, partial [Acidobacteria bacterium]|nr:MerR family transcriptional regulator [Acidobacteriota bacterium]